MSAPKPGKHIDLSRYPRKMLARDEVLFVEQELSRELYVLLVGSLGVFRDEVHIATIDEPLSIVGEVSALTGEPRGATVRALHTATLVEVADPDAFFTEYPQMGAKLARLLAARLQALNRRFVDVKSKVRRATPRPVAQLKPRDPVPPARLSSEADLDPGDFTVVNRPGEVDAELFAALTSILDFNPDTT